MFILTQTNAAGTILVLGKFDTIEEAVIDAEGAIVDGGPPVSVWTLHGTCSAKLSAHWEKMNAKNRT